MYGVEHRGEPHDAAGARRSGARHRRLPPTTRVDDDDRLRCVTRCEQLAEILRIAFRKSGGCRFALGDAVPKRHEACRGDSRLDGHSHREYAGACAWHRVGRRARHCGSSEKKDGAALRRTLRAERRLAGHDLRRFIGDWRRIAVERKDGEIRGADQNRSERLRSDTASASGREKRTEKDDDATPWKVDSAPQAERQ